MLYNYSDQLYRTLEDELNQVAGEQAHILPRLALSLEKIRAKLKELEILLKEHPLADERQEIEYFKVIQPRFYSQLIYHVKYYNLEKGLQSDDKTTIISYYREEQEYINRFFRRNLFFHEYYRLGSIELDSLYFTQRTHSKSILLPEFPSPDASNAAISSGIFSKIIAYEKLSRDVQDKLNLISSDNTTLASANKTQLRWTGDTINLVELAYGLYLTGQLGNGNASLKAIAEWLEGSLNVPFSNIHRRFTEISRRKRYSHTRFLDQMRDSILARVEEDPA